MIGLSAEIRESPALRAKLDILLLLAASLHPHRASLRRSDPEGWLDYLDKLAEEFEGDIAGADERGHARNVWEGFSKTVAFARAPAAVRAALEAVGNELESWLNSGRDPLEYLEQANARAHAFVAAVLNREGLADLVPQPARVEVTWDGEARRSCAATSRLTGGIEWSLQPRRHAVPGAIVAEQVLAHEYLSHLVPRNSSRMWQVKEAWLLELLRLEIEQPLDRLLLIRFRRDVAAAVGQSDLDPYFPGGARDHAMWLYRAAPRLFWHLTGDLLRVEGGAERGQQVERILQELAELLEADGTVEAVASYLERVRLRGLFP